MVMSGTDDGVDVDDARVEDGAGGVVDRDVSSASSFAIAIDPAGSHAVAAACWRDPLVEPSRPGRESIDRSGVSLILALLPWYMYVFVMFPPSFGFYSFVS